MIEQPEKILIVGAIGLLVNILGLFLFHGHGHGHEAWTQSWAHGHSHGHGHGKSIVKQFSQNFYKFEVHVKILGHSHSAVHPAEKVEK